MKTGQFDHWLERRPDKLAFRLLAGTAVLFVLMGVFATDIDDLIYPNDFWGRNVTDLAVVFGVVLPVFYFALFRPLLRLLEERRQAEESLRLRARELGAVNAVSEVASRELDLERLLSRVVDVVLSVFDAQGGRLLILEGGPASSPRVVVSRGMPPALGASALNDLCRECPTSCWGMLERLPPGEITVITDCNDLPREALHAAGFAGHVGVLLPVGRQVRAVLNLVWRSPRTLDEADRALLRAVARQVGIAAENAALYDAEQRAREKADAIASVGLALSQTLDLEAVLQTLFEHIGRFVPYDRAKVMLREGESVLKVQAVLSLEGRSRSARSVPSSFDVSESPLARTVLETQQSLSVSDLKAAPVEAGSRPSALARSWLGVPLMVSGRAIGLFTLVKAEPGFYTPEQVKLAEALAAPASAAIANARLFGDVLSGRARMEMLSKRLVEVEESERRHLARELHDEVGQLLTAILYRLEAAQRTPDSPAHCILKEASEIADRAIRSVRDLALDLRPSLLDEAGLAETLRWYINRQVRSDSLDVELFVSPDAALLSHDIRTACFRVAQEALTNVVRHAQARHARVELRKSTTRIELAVSDDGRGFDVDEARKRARSGESLGILGMQERAELLGGTVVFDSSPGKGTTVRAVLPLSGVADMDASA